MKTILKTIATAAIATFMALAPANLASAGSINTIVADGNDTTGVISVSGEAGAGVVAVAIAVYAEDGTTVLAMHTTSVASDNTYQDTFTMTNSGTYIVKAADYNGSTDTFATDTVTITLADDDTGDNTDDADSNNSASTANTGSGVTKSNDYSSENIIPAIVATAAVIVVAAGIFFALKVKKSTTAE
ncbi:hypothetical protein IKG54_01030 [Candidatus Saccharibacteria bacterium]|nr:hypothetical protein [Candidatus Saccharibacteria bacterium]